MPRAGLLRVIAEDERAEVAQGRVGVRRRVLPLDEIRPRPPPQNPGPKPGRKAGGEKQAQILQAIVGYKRLPASDAREAFRQVQNHEMHSWLKKHSLKAVARTELSRRRRALLQSCFEVIDGNGSGTIEPSELNLAMSTLGFSEEDVRLAFERCDKNGDGKLDFDDFVQLFTFAWAHRETRQAFVDSFARDMSEVVANACRPLDREPSSGALAGADDDADADEPHVSTSFPFALVANSHRITKLVNACDPAVRDLRLPKLGTSDAPANAEKKPPGSASFTDKRKHASDAKLPNLIPVRSEMGRRGSFKKQTIAMSIPEQAYCAYTDLHQPALAADE